MSNAPTETMKQEAKEILEFCSGKEFCTIETKLLKGIVDEINRLTVENNQLKRITTGVDLVKSVNHWKKRAERAEANLKEVTVALLKLGYISTEISRLSAAWICYDFLLRKKQ